MKWLILLVFVANICLADSNFEEELKGITKVAELNAVESVEPKFSKGESIDSLLDEVQRLKAEQAVVKRNILNTESPKKASAIGSNTVYPYIEGKLFEVHCGVDKVTDVTLQEGEELTSSPVAGDTVRWKIAVLKSGKNKTHLIIKPLEDNLETNLIVATDRRVYHLKLASGAWYMPQVSWNYPDDDKAEIEKAIATKNRQEVIGVNPEKLSFEYEIEGNDWKPEQVFDDGVKTFIRMPEKIREAPALFILDEEDKQMLTNYRVKGRYYIVDRLFDKAELRIGEESAVTIEKDDGSFF